MVTSLDKLSQALKEHYDVFIGSASYEERSVSILNAISDKIKFDHKLVSLSLPHKDLIKKNLAVFEKNGFTVIEIDNSNQIQTVNNFISQIDIILRSKHNASFLIDITTFTRQTLLILVRILRNILVKENQVQFLYTSAKEYSIGLPYKDKWLTRGLLEVNSVLGYSGIIRPSRPYHLIVLMGFEAERASSLVNAYEPSKITIGYASNDDSLSDENYELNKEKFSQLSSEFPYAESFEFSCIKILECKMDILKQAEKYKEYNTIVCPMNNKISTLSCALAAFDNDKLQLAIAIPAVYNYQNYSTPGDSCHIIEMPEFVKI